MDPAEFPGLNPEPPAPAAPAHPSWYQGLWPWLAGVLAGAVVIALGAAYEAAVSADTPLDDAVYIHVEDDGADEELEELEELAGAAAEGNAFPVHLYRLSPGDGPMPDDAPFAALDIVTPRVWLVSLDDEAAAGLASLLEPMLARGELPQPGERALLAGPGAKEEAIELGGEHYAVTGQLTRSAGLFFGQYISFGELPEEARADTRETRRGYLVLDGEVLREAVPEDARARYTISTGIYFAPGVTIGLAMLGLFAVALSGSAAWIRLLQNLAGRGGRFLRPAFDACRDEAALLIQTHAILYGIFFAMMALGLVFTDTYIALLAFVRDIFTTGDLRDIGEAYESGNILAAKFQTWRHNYLVATVLLGALPSLVIPGAALLKNVLSFSLIGFVMVPVLADSAFIMSFHSITMWLELEAYILVSFAALLLPIKVLRAFDGPGWPPVKAYAQGAAILGSMTLLAGGILLVAALYEATTLILLR